MLASFARYDPVWVILTIYLWPKMAFKMSRNPLPSPWKLPNI